MTSTHKTICIGVGCVAFFGCMAIEPVGTLAFTAGVAWFLMRGEQDDD